MGMAMDNDLLFLDSGNVGKNQTKNMILNCVVVQWSHRDITFSATRQAQNGTFDLVKPNNSVGLIFVLQ